MLFRRSRLWRNMATASAPLPTLRPVQNAQSPLGSYRAPVAADIIEKAGTHLPGIPHQYRVTRLYRQWLKLSVVCPSSALTEMNEHTQMNERMIIIVRQKFREGAGVRDPQHIAVMVQNAERSLMMFRELAADGAKRKYPEAKARLNLHKFGFMEMGKINLWQACKEYINSYVLRRW